MKTGDLFAEIDPKPRKTRQWLMHVWDAGDGNLENGVIAIMKCKRCGAETEWLAFDSVTESKRGVPCQKCNGEKSVQK